MKIVMKLLSLIVLTTVMLVDVPVHAGSGAGDYLKYGVGSGVLAIGFTATAFLSGIQTYSEVKKVEDLKNKKGGLLEQVNHEANKTLNKNNYQNSIINKKSGGGIKTILLGTGAVFFGFYSVYNFGGATVKGVSSLFRKE